MLFLFCLVSILSHEYAGRILAIWSGRQINAWEGQPLTQTPWRFSHSWSLQGSNPQANPAWGRLHFPRISAYLRKWGKGPLTGGAEFLWRAHRHDILLPWMPSGNTVLPSESSPLCPRQLWSKQLPLQMCPCFQVPCSPVCLLSRKEFIFLLSTATDQADGTLGIVAAWTTFVGCGLGSEGLREMARLGH